jgi:carbamoyl-phosphate synthase large subunit
MGSEPVLPEVTSMTLSPLNPSSEKAGMSRPTRVLVTGAGGPAAVSFLQAAVDTDVELWAADHNRYAAGLYLVPAERRVLLPEASAREFADRLLVTCRAMAIDVIVPTLDDELLPIVAIRPRLAAAGISVLASSETAISSCLDRWLFVKACLKNDVPVPRTRLLDRPMALRGFERPFVIKRRLRGGSGGASVVGEHSVAPVVPLNGSYVLQEYVGGDEYSIDVLAYRNGHVAAVVPRSCRRTHSGIAIAGSTIADPELEELGRHVAQSLALTSVASIQVRRDTGGGPKVIGVCPRFGSGTPLTVASGVNMPALSLGDALGKPGPSLVGHREVSMVRYWDHRFVETSELEGQYLAELEGPHLAELEATVS